MVRNYEETDGHEIFVVRDVISMYDVKYQTKNRKNVTSVACHGIHGMFDIRHVGVIYQYKRLIQRPRF